MTSDNACGSVYYTHPRRPHTYIHTPHDRTHTHIHTYPTRQNPHTHTCTTSIEPKGATHLLGQVGRAAHKERLIPHRLDHDRLDPRVRVVRRYIARRELHGHGRDFSCCRAMDDTRYSISKYACLLNRNQLFKPQVKDATNDPLTKL